MQRKIMRPVSSALASVRRLVAGPAGLASLPAASLAAFWLGGEPGLILAALGLPAVIVLLRGPAREQASRPLVRDPVTGLVDRAQFETGLADLLREAESRGRQTACFLIELHGIREIAERQGSDKADAALRRSAERVQMRLRETELVARVGSQRFAVALGSARHLDVETCIQLAARLQRAIERPMSAGGMTVDLASSIGFCLSGTLAERGKPGHGTRTPEPARGAGAGPSRNEVPARDLYEAAEMALDDALAAGPMTIRAFTHALREDTRLRRLLAHDIARALEDETFEAWFQPQVSTETGEITGFESLARWHHPAHGQVPPAVFLPVIERNGLTERLGALIMNRAFEALSHWDAEGLNVPRIGINLSEEELRNPRLVDRLDWALDRYGIAPGRVAIEILETVVTVGADDMVVRNIRRLAELGCEIELDDFGTGSTSISSLRTLPINRLKIDRSFVSRVDTSPDQQKMIAAILTMAEQLGLDTLAEGVETAGEHAIVAQLGCRHVQGYAVGRPMPRAAATDWIRHYRAERAQPPSLGSQTG